jgi:3-hydroxyisobutyrate dehydrogenase-like beta-hydroxyacid dehydrogenase
VDALDVGIVGVGEMGRPMIDRMRAAGHRVSAFVRRPEAVAQLRADGIDVVGSLPELAEGRAVVVVCVFTDEQVRQVALEGGLVEALDPDAVVVSHTTGNPRTVEAIASRRADVHVVDAPVSGGPHKIVAGNITLLVGGSDEAVARCRPVLSTYGDPIIHLGPLGSGQRVKLINNILFGSNIELARQAANVGRAFGIAPEVLARTLTSCSGSSAVMEMVAALGSPEAFLDAAGRFVHKDILVARSVAQDLGADLGLLDTVASALIEVMDAGIRPSD